MTKLKEVHCGDNLMKNTEPARGEPHSRGAIGRRAIVKSGLGVGLALGLSPAAASAQDDPASVRPKAGDLLVRVDDPSLKPLRADDIAPGMTQVMAWAMDPTEKIVRRGSRLNRIMLLRLDEAVLVGETKARAAAGVVAYTAICTHTGCDVSDWLADEDCSPARAISRNTTPRTAPASSMDPRRARCRRCRSGSPTDSWSSPDRSRLA